MELVGKSGKSPAPPAPARNPIAVWLIEDNHTFRKTVTRVLNDVQGVDCSHQFANAEDALDALLGGAVPDVVLLDVELPGQSGIQAVSQIKAISPSTRVIMLTVFDDHEKVFKAICAGASGYLLKTSSIERIVESVYEALEGGAPMTPRVAKSVLDMFAKLSGPERDYGLTHKEQKVLELMAQGLIKKEIADHLALSYHTVDTHIRNIYTKLHVNTRTGAVAKALQERLF
jgi:DNA-binding NarL/FixJ family response regulator